MALLNDSKYGHSAENGVMSLNLLRSPSYPDPSADRAQHRFTYALYPHQGDFIQAGVYRQGYELNIPLAVVEAVQSAEGTSLLPDGLLQLDHPQVMVEAVKKAEDSDHLILRLYETAGAGAEARLSFGLDCRTIEEADLMEKPVKMLAEGSNELVLTFTPFEIKTLRVAFAGLEGGVK